MGILLFVVSCGTNRPGATSVPIKLAQNFVSIGIIPALYECPIMNVVVMAGSEPARIAHRRAGDSVTAGLARLVDKVNQ
jgi:hypothetical protein